MVHYMQHRACMAARSEFILAETAESLLDLGGAGWGECDNDKPPSVGAMLCSGDIPRLATIRSRASD